MPLMSMGLGDVITLFTALATVVGGMVYTRAQVESTTKSLGAVVADVASLRQQLADERVESARRYMTIEQFGATEARMLTQFDTIRAELSELHRVLIGRAEQAPSRRDRNTGV
jgi:hypothetical protein